MLCNKYFSDTHTHTFQKGFAMKMVKLSAAVLSSVILILLSLTTAFADVKLPDGAVKGLPEKITAMDSSGRSVNSETGEYFFVVENMAFGEVYTKDVQLMNLCDKEAYNIYFSVEPLPESKKGEIDLEEACVCSFYLDGEQFYKGSITGIGDIDLTQAAHDLGYYKPGDTHTLSCSIAWVNEPGEFFIDEGHKIIDKTGMWIMTPRSGDDKIDGEIEFKWRFFAVKDEDYVPPATGILSADGTFLIICMAVIAVMIAVMFILLAKKKSKKKNKSAS